MSRPGIADAPRRVDVVIVGADRSRPTATRPTRSGRTRWLPRGASRGAGPRLRAPAGRPRDADGRGRRPRREPAEISSSSTVGRAARHPSSTRRRHDAGGADHAWSPKKASRGDVRGRVSRPPSPGASAGCRGRRPPQPSCLTARRWTTPPRRPPTDGQHRHQPAPDAVSRARSPTAGAPGFLERDRLFAAYAHLRPRGPRVWQDPLGRAPSTGTSSPPSPSSTPASRHSRCS